MLIERVFVESMSSLVEYKISTHAGKGKGCDL